MRKLYFLCWLLLSSALAIAQDEQLRLNLDYSGKTYIKASVRAQFWARLMEMNPGTHINQDTLSHGFDLSVRRLRMNVSAQLSPRVFVFVLLGNNNQNFRNKPDFKIDLLDYYVEYKVADELELGFGESAWGGQSRWNVRSTLSLMAIDAPLFTLSTINRNDDLARTLGIWAKGQLGRVDYHLAVKEPSPFGVPAQEGITDYAMVRERHRYSGFLKYQFLDHESNKTSYAGGTGTYLGQKRIFNLGAGLLYQKNMTASLEHGQETLHDFRSWTIEAFYDSPLDPIKGTALTSYLGFFHTDFGPDYIRNLAANNYSQGGTSFNGPGNGFPMIGTGNTLFFQLGYLMKKEVSENYQRQWQPNIAIQYSDYERLSDRMVTYDIGVNYYLNGHANKLSLGLQNRPVFVEYELGHLTVEQRKSSLVLQYQIMIN